MVVRVPVALLVLFLTSCEDRFVSTAADPLIAAAETIDRAGDLEHARALLRKASQREVTAAEATAYLAQIEERKSKADDCLRDLGAAIKSNIWPNRANKLYFQLAVCQELKGEHTAAMTAYNKSIELRSTLPVAFVRRGLLKEMQGDLDGALVDLKAGAANYLPGRLVLGLFYYRRGQPDQVRPEIEYLKEHRPEYGRILADLIEGKI